MDLWAKPMKNVSLARLWPTGRLKWQKRRGLHGLMRMFYKIIRVIREVPLSKAKNPRLTLIYYFVCNFVFTVLKSSHSVIRVISPGF